MSDTAQTLLLEDELKKILHGKANQKQMQREKQSGFIPRGEHSCFGDFPQHLYAPVMKSASALVERFDIEPFPDFSAK